MAEKLPSLAKRFNKSIFRLPDYQRVYDWKIIIGYLRTVKTNRRDSTRSALVELREKGII